MNPRRAERGHGPKRNVAEHRVQDSPLAKRFHRHPTDSCGKLRYWEVVLWNNLHSRLPGRRFCANLLADSLYIIYRSREAVDVGLELDWLMDNRVASDICGFIGLAEVFDIEPEVVRRAVQGDITAGRICSAMRV